MSISEDDRSHKSYQSKVSTVSNYEDDRHCTPRKEIRRCKRQAKANRISDVDNRQCAVGVYDASTREAERITRERQDEDSRIRKGVNFTQETERSGIKMRGRELLIQEQQIQNKIRRLREREQEQLRQKKIRKIRERELLTKANQLPWNGRWGDQERGEIVKKFTTMSASARSTLPAEFAIGGRASRIRDREEFTQRPELIFERREFLQSLRTFSHGENALKPRIQKSFDESNNCASNEYIPQQFTPEDDNVEARKNMIALEQEEEAEESYYDILESEQ